MRLYSYWRSTTSYRVRIALHLKGIDHEVVPVNLAKGEQNSPGFAALNPARGVPVLVLEDGTTLTQSLAIIDYLEGIRPKPSLLPARQPERARVMAAAHVVALDIHPVNNLRVVQRLKAMGHGPEETAGWMRHWMNEGLNAFQAMIRTDTPFAFGDAPGLADICTPCQAQMMPSGRRCAPTTCRGQDEALFLLEIDHLLPGPHRAPPQGDRP